MNESNESIIDSESEGPLQDDVNKPGSSQKSKGGGITCSVPECYITTPKGIKRYHGINYRATKT